MLLPTLSSEYNKIKTVLFAEGANEKILKELDSVYIQAGDALIPEQISDIPKLLPVVFTSALEDNEDVRKAALSVLTKLAKGIEQNQYLKNGDSWSEVKECIIKSLPRITQFLENGVEEWCQLWCIIISLHGSQLISDYVNINSLLKIVEKAFKMKIENGRLLGFTCWHALIDNFSLVATEMNSRYLNLILIPLKAPNHSNSQLCHAKLETWKHLMKQIEHCDANIKQAVPSFLQFLYEELGSLAPASYHFPEEAAQSFVDIVKRPNMFRLLSDRCVKYSAKCIVSISSNSSLALEVWNSILDGVKHLLWPDDTTFELVNTLKELSIKIGEQSMFARIVITTLSGSSAMPVRMQCRHFETLVVFVLTAQGLQNINENELLNFLDVLKSTNQVHIKLFKDMLDRLLSISNGKSTSKENEYSNLFKLMRTVWLTVASTVSDWFVNGGNLSQNDDQVAEEVNFIHMLLLCGCANLSCKWNKRMLKQWKELYGESYKNFVLHPTIKQNQIIVDFVNLLLTGLQSNKIPLPVAIDVASELLEIHRSADAENLMPYLLEIAEGSIKALHDDIASGMSVINQYLSVLLSAATSYYSLVPQISLVTEKMSNFKQDLPALNMRIYNKIMKVHRQVLSMKQSDKNEVRSSSPTVTSFMHRLAKAKQNQSQKLASSPLRERCLIPQLLTPCSPTKLPKQSHPKIDGDSQDFVMIPPKSRTTPLTEHQKEQLFSRPHDIPALYQDLSQDTQSQSNSFECLISSVENKNSGHFLSPVLRLETNTYKSDGMPKSSKNLLKIINETANKSFAVEKINEADNVEKSEVVLNSEENKGLTKIDINSVEKNTAQQHSREATVENNDLVEKVKTSVENKDVLDKKRKSEQNYRVKNNNKNVHDTSGKGLFGLNNKVLDSSSSDNLRITRSASKPNGMRQSISLPIMEVQSGTFGLRKSDKKLSKNTTENNKKTPAGTKRKQDLRCSSVEPRPGKKERLSKISLNMSLNEKRRVTRQSSENISVLGLAEGDEGETNGTYDVMKSGDLMQKNASGVMNSVHSEKQIIDDILKSKLKPGRPRRKSTSNSSVILKKIEDFVSKEDVESAVKTTKANDLTQEDKSEKLNLLLEPCNHKELLSVSATENGVISDTTEESVYKKLCASNEENYVSVGSNTELENNILRECVDTNIKSSEESKAGSVISEKDVNMKRTEEIQLTPADKNQCEDITVASNVNENYTDSLCGQLEVVDDHSEENSENPMNAETTISEDTVRTEPPIVKIDECSEQLCNAEDQEQNPLHMEKVDGNANIKNIARKSTESSSAKNLCENEKKLVILLEHIETEKSETINNGELQSIKSDVNNKQRKHILKEGGSDINDVLQHVSGNETNLKNKSLQDGLICKELKVVLERSPVKQGTTYIASKLASPVKLPELNISGDVSTINTSATAQTSRDSPLKNKTISESAVAEENSTKIAEHSTEEPKKNEFDNDYEVHLEEVSKFNGICNESANENTAIGEKTVSSDSDSVTSHNIINNMHKQDSSGNIKNSETYKVQECSENKSQKCEDSHKKGKVVNRKSTENPQSPTYNKKYTDPKKQTTLMTLNKWILRTPTKKLSPDDMGSCNTNSKELDTSNISKPESQDIILDSQDFVESSQQELLAKDLKNCSIILDKLHDRELETHIKTSLLTKTNVCSSPVRNVGVSLSPLQESSKNVNHVQKCTPTKKSVCRRLDKEIEGVHKEKSLEQTQKENCIGSCKCKYTNKLETLPINPAFHVDASSVCVDSFEPTSQHAANARLTKILCKTEFKQKKHNIVHIADDDDFDDDDDDIFDIKRPRKSVDSEKQSNTINLYFAASQRAVNCSENNSDSASKNGSPLHRNSSSTKENGSPLCRKLESPIKNGSPPNSRIIKNEIQVSPRSRTAHLIELAKQDPMGIGNLYSPVKLGSAKARRIRPTRVVGTELTSVDIGGAKEDWVRHKYSPLASPNTSILKRKMCETPDIITPNTKRKRVSFLDPPVSESLVFSNNEPGKGQIQRPDQKKGLNGYFEVDCSEAQVGSNDPVFPALESCRHPVTKVLEKFISSHWLDQMETSLEKINVHTVGDFSTMSEAAIYSLMCSSFKLEMLKKALQEYYDSTSLKDLPCHGNMSALLDTKLIDDDLQGIAALASDSPEIKQVKFNSVCEEVSEQNCDKMNVDKIVNEIKKNPDIVKDLGQKLDVDVIMKMLSNAVNKLKST